MEFEPKSLVIVSNDFLFRFEVLQHMGNDLIHALYILGFTALNVCIHFYSDFMFQYTNSSQC